MWKFYTDSACTTEFAGTLQLVHLADLSDNPQDNILYYANVDEDPGDNQIIQQEAFSAPGTDPIAISIVDADVGNGHETDEVTLALTSGDLGTNTAGGSLEIGTTLLSGVSQAVEVHIRVENAVTAPSTSTELSLQIVSTFDSEV